MDDWRAVWRILDFLPVAPLGQPPHAHGGKKREEKPPVAEPPHPPDIDIVEVGEFAALFDEAPVDRDLFLREHHRGEVTPAGGGGEKIVVRGRGVVVVAHEPGEFFVEQRIHPPVDRDRPALRLEPCASVGEARKELQRISLVGGKRDVDLVLEGKVPGLRSDLFERLRLDRHRAEERRVSVAGADFDRAVDREPPDERALVGSSPPVNRRKRLLERLDDFDEQRLVRRFESPDRVWLVAFPQPCFLTHVGQVKNDPPVLDRKVAVDEDVVGVLLVGLVAGERCGPVAFREEVFDRPFVGLDPPVGIRVVVVVERPHVEYDRDLPSERDAQAFVDLLGHRDRVLQARHCPGNHEIIVEFSVEDRPFEFRFQFAVEFYGRRRSERRHSDPRAILDPIVAGVGIFTAEIRRHFLVPRAAAFVLVVAIVVDLVPPDRLAGLQKHARPLAVRDPLHGQHREPFLRAERLDVHDAGSGRGRPGCGFGRGFRLRRFGFRLRGCGRG